MKVALVHWRLFNVGGLESRLRNYLNFFYERGDDVTLFCYKQSDDFFIPEGVKVVRINLGAMPKPYRLWYFNHKLQRIFNANEFDFSLSLSRTSQQDACLAPGDHLGFLKAINKKIKQPKDLIQINLDKLSFAHSAIIFPCSDLVKQNLIKLYKIPEEKLFTLYPPLDTKKYNQAKRADRANLRTVFNMHPNKKTFVIASTAHKRKGVPLLLKIFKELKDFPVELKIVGKPRVRTRLPNVEYLGHSKNTQDLFTAADFSIHPAKYEPFGQVISESLACGTPVLISENTGWSTNLPVEYGEVVKGFEISNWVKAIKKSLEIEYHIDQDFATKYDLSIERHMEKMLSCIS